MENKKKFITIIANQLNMNKIDNNNEVNVHSNLIKDNQNNSFNEWNGNDERNKRICHKCGVKENKIHMDEFANGMFICIITLFCQRRRSQILATVKQQN